MTIRSATSIFVAINGDSLANMGIIQWTHSQKKLKQEIKQQ